MDQDYGKKIYNLLVGVVVVAVLVGLYVVGIRGGDPAGRDPSATSCSDVLRTLVSATRDDRSIDGELMDGFADQCPYAYAVWVDYQSIKAFHEADTGGRCREYANYDVTPAAIRLARRDGFCTA